MSRKRIYVWPSLIALVVILTAIAFVSAEPKPSVIESAQSQSETPQESQNPATRQIASAKPLEHVETAQTTLTRWGFQPNSITVKAGAVVLMVNNRSGMGTMTWNVNIEGGNRLYEATIPSEELDWTKEAQLSAGTYILTEANHPDWTCRLTVVSQ